MRNSVIESSSTLMSAFEPGVGENPSRDNMGGAILKELTGALKNITMASHLEETQYLTRSTVKAVCNAVEWFEMVFSELERKDTGKS